MGKYTNFVTMKDILFAVAVVIIIGLIFKLVAREKEYKQAVGLDSSHIGKLIDEKENLRAQLMELSKQMDYLDIEHQQELKQYANKPVKERIKLITKIDSFAIPTDTGAILSLHGVDSINKLALQYVHCKTENVLRDSIINIQDLVIKSDSGIIEKQQILLKQAQKSKRTNLAIGAVIGFIFGLIL